jgi:hypothetical protein
LVEEAPISGILVDGNRNIEIRFNDVKAPHNKRVAYQYFVTLTSTDIGRIMAEVYKQALTKNN